MTPETTIIQRPYTGEELMSRIPPDLAQKANWVLHDANKVPYQPDGCNAKTNDSSTWSSLESVCEHVGQECYTGIGYVFDGTGIIGIDLDGAIVNGEIQPWAQEIVDRFGSLTEYSPSGTGLHIYGLGELPRDARKRARVDAPGPGGKSPAIEMYDNRRYFCLTADWIPDSPEELTDVRYAIEWLFTSYFAEAPARATPGIGSSGLPRETFENLLRRGRAYIENCAPALRGDRNNSAFGLAGHLAAFDESGHQLSEDQIIELLRIWNAKNPEPLDDRELEGTVHSAMKNGTPRELKPSWVDREGNASLDIIVPPCGLTVTQESCEDVVLESCKAASDYGGLPANLLRVPGFINQVMDYALETAPYPNTSSAFVGAAGLLGFLAGRKVRDPGNNRTNFYFLVLANSGSGKDWPRKVNAQILKRCNLLRCLGDQFASAEGLEDALFQTPSMLFQVDEMDTLLRSMAGAKDARYEAMLGTLLRMFSTANSDYVMRRKANQEGGAIISQPHLVLTGAAIPTGFYEALNERMLTHGLLARMVVIEAGPRGIGQEPTALNDIPMEILDTAQWWADYKRDDGNLQGIFPDPRTLDLSEGATTIYRDSRHQVDEAYSRAERNDDPVACALWARVHEMSRKLGLLYAISENREATEISGAAAQWGTTFARAMVDRMRTMARTHSATTEHEKKCVKIMEKLRKAPHRRMDHSPLLRRMKGDAKTFRSLIETLLSRGDITVFKTEKGGAIYQLTNRSV